MSDLIATAQRFYAALNLNNTKEWWHENKPTYEAELKAPSLALLERLAPEVSELTGHPVKTKLFRPHRDVRFSKDKTPYNTHLHMMWSVEAGVRQDPVFFFGIGLDYVTIGAGLMGLDKPVLEDWRKMVDLDTERLMALVGALRDKGYDLRAPELKRVPAPYDKDHPAQDLLRMRSVVASKQISGDLDTALIQGFSELLPLNTALIQIAEA